MTMPNWSHIKRSLSKMPRPGLVGLLKELFELSPENRSFLAARFLSEQDPQLIKAYRQRVTDPFCRKRGFGNLDFANARKAIREYEKATGDLKGVIDLMLTFVESGTTFTREFGDMNERFYNGVESMLWEAMKRLRTRDGKAMYPAFAERLRAIAQAAYGIGWGFGDNVNAAVAELEAEMQPDNG
jgi:hypothetical protein